MKSVFFFVGTIVAGLLYLSGFNIPTQKQTENPRSYMLFAPILPDKMEAFRMFIDEIKGDRTEEWNEARKALGMVRERLWVQYTPQGNFLIVYQENTKPEQYVSGLLNSKRDIDRYFVSKLKELHGIDLTAEQPAPNELLWRFKTGSFPNPAVAFFVPVLKGKEAQHQALFKALNGEKQDAAVASQRRWGLTREMFWEQKTPAGTFMIVYQESSDFEMMGGEILSSNDAFDLWFFQQINEIYGVDVYGYEPIPQNSQVLDWEAK